METVRLSELEQRVYSDLFTQCDVENCGQVSGVGASNLFISSGLSQDVLNQITELCGAKRLGHFGRIQFYIALKLIAAAQVGLPVMLESLNSGQDIPLPAFAVLQTNTDPRRMNQYSAIEQDTGQSERRPSHGSSHIQPPPKHSRHHRNNIHGHDGPAGVADNNVISPAQSPPVCISPPGEEAIKQPNVGPAVLPNQIHPSSTTQHASANHGAGSIHLPASKMHPGVGPGHVSANQTAGMVRAGHVVANQVMAGGGTSGSPIHSMDKAWASFDEDNQGLISSERKEWAHFTDSSSKHDTSSISSETDSVDDVWSITDEQRHYYVNQFKSMQPDVRGVISGGVAKEFFEKSRLPVAELSKIWQLSDVNRDGALSLEEFCTAMHLVVLRRNEIELPDHLPPALIPYVPLNPEEPFAADLPPGSTIKKMSPIPPSPPQPTQWTGGYVRGQESPTSSSVSSPGSKPTPVNFDYKPIIADAESKIVHPVALRMSPDGHAVLVEGNEQEYEGEQAVTSPTTGYPGDGPDDQIPPGTLPTFGVAPIQGRPRPTPKKSQSVPGGTDYMAPAPRLLPPPSSQDHSAASGDRPVTTGDQSVTSDDWPVTSGDRPVTLPVVGMIDDLAPMPPPRPRSGHMRSTSLDNQLIDFTDHRAHRLNQTQPPPAVPPRLSHTEGGGYDHERPGSGQAPQPTYTSTPAKYLVSQVSTETKNLRESLRTQRLRNMALSRVNNELHQELQEIMEQRIALEIQLEHLRPFHT